MPTPRVKDRPALDVAVEALRDIAFDRPLGPTRSARVERLERIAVNALDTISAAANNDLSKLLDEVERKWPGSFWYFAKGRMGPSEPLFGFQVLFGTDEILADGEGDSAASAILAALTAQGK